MLRAFHMILSLTISQTAPVKKLPAFYVLDSVVKNVGTPYTLFFGRNLYSTFMEAYVLVDNNIRRKMEEMLKTWKEPVPGSIDTRPVFPVEVTRPIENALIKARTSALQAHQEYARSQQQPMGRGRPGMVPDPYRNTPTPPNAFRPPQYAQQGYGSTYGQPYPTDQVGQAYNQQQYGTPQVRRLRQSHSYFDCINQFNSHQ
jgi:pre-mRNA cleavage complex 2 protein Pcf11